MAKSKLTVDELLDQLNGKLNLAKIQASEGLSRGQLIQRSRAAAERGDPLIAIKNFTFDGKTYQHGDLFDYNPRLINKVVALAEFRFYIPETDFNSSKEAAGLRGFMQNVVDPKKSRLLEMRTRLAEMQGQYNQALAEVTRLENEIKTKQGAISQAEVELLDILQPEVDGLVG